MKTKIVLLLSVSLLIIDQVIKIVIDQYFLDVRFEIIPSLFYFKPTFNDQYSYINGLFRLGMGFWTHIILYCFVLALFVVYYSFMKKISGPSKWLTVSFSFGFAGIFCGFVGTIFWNGCLDYIYLKPLFVFDLKDLYINAFVILFLLYYVKNRQMLSAFKTKDMIGHVRDSLKWPEN